MNKIAIMILVGLMIPLASAIYIIPDRLDLNLSAGESYTSQFEIYSDIDSNVLVTSSNPNCLMQETNFSVSSGINYKNLTIYIPFNAKPSIQDCEFRIGLINIPDAPLVSQGGSYSRKKVIIPNVTTNQSLERRNTTTFTNETMEVETEKTQDNNQTNETTPTKEVGRVQMFVTKIANFVRGIINWVNWLFK